MAKKRKRKAKPPQSSEVKIFGYRTRRGEKMLPGPYRLANVNTKRVFVGSLIDTINKGKVRLAIFSVPKR